VEDLVGVSVSFPVSVIVAKFDTDRVAEAVRLPVNDGDIEDVITGLIDSEPVFSTDDDDVLDAVASFDGLKVALEDSERVLDTPTGRPK
jgi:hypothetical protein